MNTRVLMTLSAAFMATLGVGLTFLPQELLAHFGIRPDGTVVLLIQLLGALYLGLATLNWMNRGAQIGGIYGRPVSMANFFSLSVGALALVKGAIAQQFAIEVAAMAAIHSLFGIWFGLVLVTHPTNEPPK
jgi:hypothetical protein